MEQEIIVSTIDGSGGSGNGGDTGAIVVRISIME